MTDGEGRKVAEFIVGRFGGFLIAAFLLPVGCTEVVRIGASCPAGQATNFLGWTVEGLVGRLDKPGLIVLGLIIAVSGYYLVNWLNKPSRH